MTSAEMYDFARRAYVLASNELGHSRAWYAHYTRRAQEYQEAAFVLWRIEREATI